MLTPDFTTQFRKDLRRVEKQGKDPAKVRAVLEDLIQERPLAPARRDHALKGDWKGCRDCHVEPDWVLIDMVDAGRVRFLRTGSHADLFE